MDEETPPKMTAQRTIVLVISDEPDHDRQGLCAASMQHILTGPPIEFKENGHDMTEPSPAAYMFLCVLRALQEAKAIRGAVVGNSKEDVDRKAEAIFRQHGNQRAGAE